jgi:hypothetical protein
MFRDLFPASAWCLRKLASRPARYIYVCIFAIVATPAVTLRVEAALFEKRAIATVRDLSTLRVGVTPKAEAMVRMQSLGPVSGPYGAPVCNADECLSLGIPNSRLSDAVFLPLVRNAPALYSILTWWGFRYWSLSVYVNFTSGKVSYLSYHLMLSNSCFDGGADSVVIAMVTSQEKLHGRSGESLSGEQAVYRVTSSSAWPDKSVGIALTPDTSQELVNRAFDLRLQCLWSLTGCKSWRELLPQVNS